MTSRLRKSARARIALAFIASSALTAPAHAQAADGDARISTLEARIEALEAQNRRLMDLLEARTPAVAASSNASAPAPVQASQMPVSQSPAEPTVAEATERGLDGRVGLDHAYSFRMLDEAENVTTKPLVQLRAMQAGALRDRVTLSGGIAVIADYQFSDTPAKFGYLTRHPTSGNQVGKRVSEAVIHSAALALTGRLTSDLTAYFELLYDPEQSFASGTLTDINRNQIHLRRGWVMWGDLDKRPVYALLGKMDIPFGLNDTVSPFTPSTNYHAFAGLAYGAQVGFASHGLHLRAMAVQGGAQFRSANTPVKGTNVPSSLNNFALDANYTLGLGDLGSVMVGGSYQHGTAYCQGYPVVHFTPCADNVPGIAVYGRAHIGPVTLLGEYAQTTKVWRGTAVPAIDPRIGKAVTPPQQVWLISPNPLSVYKPVKPRSLTLGGRFAFGKDIDAMQERSNALSLEFSRFIAGDDGSPWEGQSQTVLGYSHFASASVNLFAEAILVDGFVPLNFLSGGNFANGSSWSDQEVSNKVFVVGVQAAF